MKRALVLMLLVALIMALMVVPAYADIVQFGSDVTIPEGDREPGNIVLFGGNATINGDVGGGVTIFGGNLELNGEVGGDVLSFGGNTDLGSDSVIRGDLTTFGGNVDRAPGARILGNERTGVSPFFPFGGVLFGLIGLIFTLALSALIVAVFPKQTGVLADTVEGRPLESLGVGFGATILIPVVVILLVITIIGLLVLPFFALAVPVIYLYGNTGVYRWLGRRFIEATHIVQESPIAQVLTGALLIGLIGLVPIVGWIVTLVVAFFGLGAVLISRFGTGRPWRGVAPQAPPMGPEEQRAA